VESGGHRRIPNTLNIARRLSISTVVEVRMSLAYSTIIDRVPDSSSSDADAVERLKDSIALQQAAFRRDPYPSAPARREHIRAIAGMLIANREQVRAALAEDFGSHPDEFADLIEILGPVGRVAHALESLDDWMADDARPTDPGLFGSGRAFVRYEPKGVIGNMTPWNFPFEVACGPLVEMLAAGNRVIIKPSDLTPASGEALAEIIAQTFDRDHVTVAVGGLELAKQFASQPWDHLMYTGSPGVGREVMRAAAEHLVPVTLELGGKCPAVLTPSADLAMAVEAIIGTKLIKNGQVCISVDHVLEPAIASAKLSISSASTPKRTYPSTHTPQTALGSSPNATSTVSRVCSRRPGTLARRSSSWSRVSSLTRSAGGCR
jgi:coniferyl-aldehyde dehydrogenase